MTSCENNFEEEDGNSLVESVPLGGVTFLKPSVDNGTQSSDVKVSQCSMEMECLRNKEGDVVECGSADVISSVENVSLNKDTGMEAEALVKSVPFGNGMCLEPSVDNGSWSDVKASQCSVEMECSGNKQGDVVECCSTDAISSVENVSLNKDKRVEAEALVDNNSQPELSEALSGVEETLRMQQNDLSLESEDCMKTKVDSGEQESEKKREKEKLKQDGNEVEVFGSIGICNLKDSNESEDMIDSGLREIHDGETSSLNNNSVKKEVSHKKRKRKSEEQNNVVDVTEDSNGSCSGVVDLNFVKTEGNDLFSEKRSSMKVHDDKDKVDLVSLENQDIVCKPCRGNSETCLNAVSEILCLKLEGGEASSDSCKKKLEMKSDIPVMDMSKKVNSVDVDPTQDEVESVKNDKLAPPDIDMLSVECKEIIPQLPHLLEAPHAGYACKKLLILDVNGILADIIPVNDGYHPSDIVISGKSVFKRPYCDDFLQFCFEKFSVGIWSSRTKRNVEMVIDNLLGHSRKKLLFCWDQSHCTDTGFTTVENHQKPLLLKELKKLWENPERDLPWSKGEYSESNTLLIDDSPYKALRNPANTAIFPRTYRHRNFRDCSLGRGGDLRVYLEQLAEAQNVQDYVAQNPFGKRAITERNPSWGFYQKVIDPNSCHQPREASSSATVWMSMK